MKCMVFGGHMNIGNGILHQPLEAQAVPLVPGNEEPAIACVLPPVLQSLRMQDRAPRSLRNAQETQFIQCWEIEKEALRRHLKGGTWYRNMGTELAERFIADKALQMLVRKRPPNLESLYDLENLYERVVRDNDEFALAELKVLAVSDPKAAQCILRWYMRNDQRTEEIKPHSIILTFLRKSDTEPFSAEDIQHLETYGRDLERIIQGPPYKQEAWQQLEDILRWANEKNNDVLYIFLEPLMKFCRGSQLPVPEQIKVSANAVFNSVFLKQRENPELSNFFIITFNDWMFSEDRDCVITALEYFEKMASVLLTPHQYRLICGMLDLFIHNGDKAPFRAQCRRVYTALSRNEHLTPRAATHVARLLTFDISDHSEDVSLPVVRDIQRLLPLLAIRARSSSVSFAAWLEKVIEGITGKIMLAPSLGDAEPYWQLLLPIARFALTDPLKHQAVESLLHRFSYILKMENHRVGCWQFIKSLTKLDLFECVSDEDKMMRINFFQKLQFLRVQEDEEFTALVTAERERVTRLYKAVKDQYAVRQELHLPQEQRNARLAEEKSFLDKLHRDLLILACLNPSNPDDLWLGEEPTPENKVVVSTGEQFDLPSLIKYHHERNVIYDNKENPESKWFLNPFSNAPFDERDLAHIEAQALRRDPPIVIEFLKRE